jgi:hypothetical protein
MTRLLLPAVLAASLWLLPGQGAASPAEDFLKQHLRLDRGDLDDLRRGEPIFRMLPDPGEREFALMGVAHLGAPPAAWTGDWAGIEFLKRTSPDLLGLGRLGVPATAADLAGLALDPEVAADLAKCVPEKCVYNLPREAIERMRQELPSGDVVPKGTEIMRGILAALAATYQEKGDVSLPVLANRKRVVTLADAPALVLGRVPSLAQLAPGLDTHFRGWRENGRPTERDLFFWSREKIWRREVTSLVHAAFEASGTLRRRVLAEKTFYANHYFRSVLAVTGIVEDPQGAFLFYVNRSETDNGSGFNFIERALANRLVKRRLSRQLKAMRERLSARLDTPTSPP